MSYRTDLTYNNGKLSVNPANNPGADTRKPLPKVDSTDLLASDKYGESWKREAGELGTDTALSSLADAQASIARSFQAFAQMRENKSPEITQAAHLRNLANDYDRSLKSLAERSDRAQKSAQSRLEAIESEFRTYVKWNAQDAAELRTVLRGMDDSDRQKVINEAVKSGDGQILAAVLGAHPTLSGLSGDLHKALRKQALNQHTPHLAKLEGAITKAAESTRTAFLQFMERRDTLTAKGVRDEYAKESAAAAEARKKAEDNAGISSGI